MQSETFLVILGMALITYATRISGLWLINWLPDSPRLQAWLRHLPGSVLTALVVPLIFTQGIAEIGAALLTILAAWRTKNILISIVVGIAAVWILRMLLP